MTGGGDAPALDAPGVADGEVLDVIGLEEVVVGDDRAEAPTECADDEPQAVSSRPARVTPDTTANCLTIPRPSVRNPLSS